MATKKSLAVKNEDSPIYNVSPAPVTTDDDSIIAHALRILESRMKAAGDSLSSPLSVRNFLRLKLAQADREIFACIYLDAQHRVIEYIEEFHGTLTCTSVYPREIVKAALRHNAAAVILCHNHPSGVAEPSQSDRMLTDALKQALSLVDVRVLDHFIVAGSGPILSFTEKGML